MYRSGSPPRVREKLRMIIQHGLNGRITPACAGKTANYLITCLLCRDHPRVCGKNSALIGQKTGFPGSPPRVREKLQTLCLVISGTRITPACAGKTSTSNLILPFEWDHPRVCGKNLLPLKIDCLIPGSPPRVREKHIAVWKI